MGWVMAGLSLSVLTPALDTSIAHAGLPVLAQAFGASFQGVQWIVLAYLLALTTVIVSAGRLGDLWGRRRLLLAGIGLFTLASLFCGLASTLGVLVFARVTQGLGAAFMMALAMSVVGDAVPKARVGSAMGLLGSMSAIGTTLGPSLGGALIAGMGWRMIFLVNLPLGLLNLWLVYRHLPVDRPGAKTARRGFDSAGTLLLAGTLTAYALAMTLGHGQFGGLNFLLLLAAAAGVPLFLSVESRVASPLLPLAIFRDRDLSTSLLTSLLVATVMMATLVVGPFYLARGLGLSVTRVGFAMSVGPLIAALAGVPAGRLVDRFGARKMTVAGLGGIVLGMLAISAASAGLGLVGYLAAIGIATSSYAVFQAANNTLVLAGLHASQRGTLSALLGLSRNLGLITGAAVMGALFAVATATTDPATARPEAVASGLRITFGAAAGLMLIALAAARRSHFLPVRPALAATGS